MLCLYCERYSQKDLESRNRDWISVGYANISIMIVKDANNVVVSWHTRPCFTIPNADRKSTRLNSSHT